MESASSRALGIAHVVANILHRQPGRQVIHGQRVHWLPRLILVNKLWADEVTEIVWAELHTLEPLERVHPDRRQYYAGKVRKLKIILDPKLPPATACLSGLLLPRLKEVELSFYYDATLQHICPVLPPLLRSVTVHCSPRCRERATEYALEAITTRCQHLEAFYFVGPSHHLNSDRLLGFISRHPTLSDIRIRLMDSITQHPLPEDVVTYLAEKSVVRKIQTPQLQLHTPKSFTSSDTFRTLELLDIRADYRSLHIISASLPRLKILKVGLVRCASVLPEPLDPILECLSGSPELEVFKLSRSSRPGEGNPGSQIPVTLSGEAFADFAQHCRNLRNLRLEIQPGVVAEDFTASHLRQAASSLRHLQEIGLFFTPEAGTLTTAAVSIFGESCPTLEACQILGDFTVLDIDWTTETIFPNLSRLCLNQIRGQKTNYSLDTYDARLRKKFPRLQLLQVMKPFPGSLSLGDSFIFDVPRIPRSDPFA